MNRTLALSVLVFSVLVFNAYAQLGEVAGPLNFNVSIGSSQTHQLILINSGNTPITVKTVLNSITTVANASTPTVLCNPEISTIPPHGEQAINITVIMPYNTSDIGKHWQAIISAVEESNVSISGTGAIIVAGMAKIANITASKPKANPLIIFAIAAGIVAIAAGGSAVYYFAFEKRKLAKGAGKARKVILSVSQSPMSNKKEVAPRARGRRKATKPRIDKRVAARKLSRGTKARSPRRRSR